MRTVPFVYEEYPSCGSQDRLDERKEQQRRETLLLRPH
jgi:hypothetical protein